MWPFRMFNKRRGLRMWIISLLEKSPKNGAEIMDSIEEMSQGWWRPSPGSMYPLLGELEQDGYIRRRDDGRYELTDKSREEVPWTPWMHGRRPQQLEDMLNEIEGYVSYFEDLSKSDRKKLEGHADRIIRLRDRLSALVRAGGEKI